MSLSRSSIATGFFDTRFLTPPIKRKYSVLSNDTCLYCNHLKFNPDFEGLLVRHGKYGPRTRIEGRSDNYYITILTQHILRDGFDVGEDQRLLDCRYCRFLYDALNRFFLEPSMDWFQDAQRNSQLFIMVHVQAKYPLIIECQWAIVHKSDWIHLRADIEVFCPDRSRLPTNDFPCMELAFPEPSATFEDKECDRWLGSFIKNCADATDRMEQCYYTPNRLLRIDWDCEEILLWELPRGPPGLPDVLGKVEYATLSHCWSEDDPAFPRLLKSNILEWVDGKSFIRLPQALLDAARVAYKNKVYYLWVESLCIIQDDEQDIQEQTPGVGAYFRDSLITIVAASSTSPNDSFLSPRKERWITKELGFTAPSGGSATIKLRRINSSPTSPTDAIDESSYKYQNSSFRRTGPLYRLQRCYQEALLGTRVISFTSAAVTVNCRRHNQCTGDLRLKYRRNDVYEGLLRPGQDRTALLPEDKIARYSRTDVFEGMLYPGQGRAHMAFWLEAVQQYTARDMAVRPRDKLSGIAGMAGMCPMAMKDQYMAGLWRTQLQESLLWEVRLHPWQTNTTKITFPYKEQKAPSFSWASVNTEVAWKETYNMHFVPDARVVEASTLPQTDQIFRGIDGAYVKLEARLLRCEVSQTLTGTGTGGKWTFAYIDLGEEGAKPKKIPFVADGSLVMVKSKKAMRDRLRMGASKGASRSVKKRIEEFERNPWRSHTFLTRHHHEFRRNMFAHGHKKITGVAYVVCLGWRGQWEEVLKRHVHDTFEGLVLTRSMRYPGAFERIGCIRNVPTAALAMGELRVLTLV
ncbi:hypothetical protein ACHAQJ_002550 [Trichoderma viride]